MALGMFNIQDVIDDNPFTGVVAPNPRGVGTTIRETSGFEIPSDLLINTDIQREFFQDFIEIFRESQTEDDGRLERQAQATEWLRVLGEYAVGNATEEDLKAVDVSDLAEMPGWSEYYSGVIGEEADTSEVETTEEDTGAISDEDAISAVMATVPDKLKGFITEENLIKVLEQIGQMNDPMAQIKRDMGAGVEIKFPEDWENWKVFGPLNIPGVPLPPGIIDVTLKDIVETVQNAGDAIGDVVGSVGGFLEDLITDPVGTIKDIGTKVIGTVRDVVGGAVDDPWGGTIGGFEDWVRGVLGNVVGGAVLTDIYDTAKGLIDPKDVDTTAVVGGTNGEDETKADIFKQLLGTVEGTLEVDPDLFVGSITDDDDTPSVIETGGLVPEPPVEPPELPPEPPVDPETPEPPITPGSVVAPPTPIPPVTPPELPPEPPVTPGGGGGGGNGGGSTVVVGGTTIDNGGGTTIDVGGLNYPPETPIEIGGTEVSTGGGGAVGGGDGMFTGDIRRTSYMPQVLPGVRVPAPVDSMATIEGLIGRMLTGRIS